MDKKKAIVIAVVLFLLIGLGTFVFANPSGERLDGDSTDNVTESEGNNEVDDGSTDGKEDNEEENTDEQTDDNESDDDTISVINDGSDNSGNGNTGNGGSNNNNNNNQGGSGSTEEDNSAYLAALAALEKAEKSFLQSDLDYANSLIDALENNNNKTDLSNRADIVQNVIDVETLVKNLQTKVNEAENINNMNDARNYRNNEEIINKVTELANSTKKDELTSILNDLNKILDDMTAPGIHGIDNGVVTATDVSLTVDESDVKVYINGEEKSLSDLNFTEEGDYTVKVVDKAFNETTIQFAIDKTAPNGYDVGILNVTHYREENPNLGYAKVDDEIRVIVHFKEQLATLPTLSINGVSLENEFFYAEDSSNVTKNDYVYMVDVKLTQEVIDQIGLTDGIITFTIKEYADALGNVGAELTNANISENANYPSVEFDSVKPVLNFNNGMITSSFTVEVTEDNFDYMIVKPLNGNEIKVTEKTYEISGNEDNLRYEITVYDKAGNVSDYRSIYLDNQAPKVEATGYNGSDVPVENGKSYQKVTVNITDGSLKKVVLLNEDGSEKEVLKTFEDNYVTEKMVYEGTFEDEGTYTIKGIDRNNQEVSITFTIDKTAPKRSAANILEYNADNNLGTYYVTKGDIIHAYVSFDEPLVENPSFVFINDGKEYVPTKVDQLLPDEKTGKYIYNAYYEVNETDMIDGEVTFKVTNIKDTAGNTTEVSEVTNGHRVFVDRSPIQKSHFYFIGTHEENRNVVGDGQYIIVEAAFDEEFTSVPRLKIGEGQYIDLDDCHWTTNWTTNKFVCRNSSVRLDNSLAKLKNGQVIPVEITNIVDRAGNETVLTNNDVTFNDTYKELVFDSRAPEMFSLGITGFLAENDDAHYITYGKGFRVLFYVDEELATYPKLKFEGNDKEYVVNPADDNDPSINRYSYFLDVPASDVTKENFKEGEVKFEIYGYKDLAGNEGESLTNKDINSEVYDKVIIDNTDPNVAYLSYLVDGDAADGVETYYATNGDKLYISTAVNEELGANPIATFTDSERKQFTSELEFTSINKNGQYIYTSYVEINPDLDVADGVLKVDVTNFKDKAGNELEETFTSSKVVIDRTFVKEVHLYALNLDKENHKLIRDKENLYLELVFDEEIVTNPIVKVGDGSEVSMACSWRDESQGWPAKLYKCDATITIDGKSMNLTTNQNIPITIKNIKDAAGNETVLTKANLTNNNIKGYGQVVYDMTPPVHATLGITGYENENYDTHYITYGKGFRVALYFNEELSEVPKVKFDNFDKEYTAVVGQDTDASKNIYSYIIDIPAGDVNAENFSEGEVKFQVYGYKDLAGNEGEVLDNKDINHPTQTKVVIDNTASVDRWVYILNSNDSSYRTSISDGETLLVEATFNEPLQTMPTLEIGNSKFVFTDEEKLGIEDHYAYRVKVNINSSLGLEEGKEIPFKITNIVDLAGNKAEFLDNNDVVYHQDKGYGQVVYENPIVSLTFHNATHYKENEDLGSNVSVTEASYGDTLRVFVRTSQDFDLVYKPIININGFTKELNLSNMYNDGTKDYGADIKITDEMNLTLGEEIPFTIENILLENGNALPNLTNEDITSNTLSGVVLVEE